MDDWQDAALSNRHLHNRVGKHGRGKGSRTNGSFDVQRVLGTYEVKCPAAVKLGMKKDDKGLSVGRLEVYHLNKEGNALVGELFLPPVVHGAAILAGSRKVMKTVVNALASETEEGEDGVGDDDVTQDGGELVGSEDDDVEVEVEEDTEHAEFDREQQRRRQFEKNSFRSPKFWLNWQPEMQPEMRAMSSEERAASRNEEEVNGSQGDHGVLADTGYLVFTGNKCNKFNGTLSCRALGWNNVKIDGFALRAQPARDVQVQWRS